jgi:germination protein M
MMKMIKILLVVLSIMLVFSVVGCQKQDSEKNIPKTPQSDIPTQNEPDELDEPESDLTPEDLENVDLTLKIYWVEAGENSLGVERMVPYTKTTAKNAMEQLLAGLNEKEKTTWPALSSAIPENTKLLGVTIEDGIAKVDFSKEFESGGGTFSVTARLAQVVYTLCEFPTIDAVEFYIEGEKVDVFSSEGLIIDGPQYPEDYYDLLPIDA